MFSIGWAEVPSVVEEAKESGGEREREVLGVWHRTCKMSRACPPRIQVESF
jgi:hypothetical protein